MGESKGSDDTSALVAPVGLDQDIVKVYCPFDVSENKVVSDELFPTNIDFQVKNIDLTTPNHTP